ncbi:2'-5' RNA ligase family protein [Kitasatospora sp. NPDC058965]|uniref:2'-5' RNA ligase family protein n=1 Tax=Kitasatospora sp. NPDC058965 TaxID=3346682 RepID=UPI00368EA9AF
MSGERFAQGQSALIVRVPEAEPLVGRWRARYDPAAAAGVPAHVTVLFPFLPAHRLDGAALDELAALVGTQPAFAVRFARCGRFPGILYLAPDSATGFLALTRVVAERWPECPPFGGRHADLVPHLTVGHRAGAEVEAAVASGLPVTAHVAEVELLVHDGDVWRRRAAFRLAGAE